MAYGTINADVVQSSVTGVSLGAGNATVFKNRLINGNYLVDQYNAGASITPTSGQYVIDRWFWQQSVVGKFTFQQNAGSVTPPAGYTNYAGYTVATAYTVTSSDYFIHQQKIEGLNVSDLAWGTANAQTITLSFWVRSSLTGTFGGALLNSAANRDYVFSYTINSANTWEQKSITIAGDTTGTWLTTNGIGIWLRLSLGAGSTYIGTPGSWQTTAYLAPTGQVNVAGTSGATWYVTGVQLEVGSSATGFEYVDYTTQLAMCQRYFQNWGGTTLYDTVCFGVCINAASAELILSLPINMRTAPTSSYSAVTDWQFVSGGAAAITSAISTDLATTKNIRVNSTGTTSPYTAGFAIYMRAAGTTSARYNLSAEL
jgi:hypothetical protein